MQSVTTIVIGAGQAGLAMSRELSARGIEHLVLERGRPGESWRRRRWENLRLLTPNWSNGLPGAPYWGPAPTAFMTGREFLGRVETYARQVSAPVVEETEVLSVRAGEEGYRLETSTGPYRCRMLVLANGSCERPTIPACAARLPKCIAQTVPTSFRRADDLPRGGVLVVGASASGVQLASEIHASGRSVTLAVGSHVRLPRRHRGRDIEWWLDAIGALDERYDDVDDVERVRATPSPQLTGWADQVDLGALQTRGIEIVGRLMEIRDGRALFSGGLAHVCAAADLKAARLLARIDDWIADTMPSSPLPPGGSLPPTPVAEHPRLELDFRSGEIASVVWATGFKPDYSWLDLPVFDRRRRLRHQGGVVQGAPGIYALGLPFLRRRRSSFISGVGADARDLATHLERHLHQRTAA
ncbi:MAG: NAD(P)/FAD-dependent oxidoreductase [Pseudomonadota bacterium]